MTSEGLTVPRRYFCCGSSLLHVVMSLYIWPSAIKGKVKVFHSLIAVGAVGVGVPLYLGHS